MNGNLGMNGINGMVANGHIPRSYHKMNINVNPLSEMDSVHSTDGSKPFNCEYFKPCLKRPIKMKVLKTGGSLKHLQYF